MTHLVPNNRLYNIVSTIVFIMGCAMFSYMSVTDWLPALMLITGISLALRQILRGQTLDVMMCFVVFGGAFFCSFFDFLARIFLPTFMILGAIYYLLRQFFAFGALRHKHPPADEKTAADESNPTTPNQEP